MEPSRTTDESRVLVIYTGGTIGMLVGHQGYVPEPYFLTQSLRSQNRFHDPLEDSLFSHAGSVQGYRDWSAGSGRSSPVGSTVSAPSPRTRRPIGVTAALDPGPAPSWRNQPQCVKVADNVYEANLPSLITPRTKVPGKNGSKAIRYAILEWNPLLDSSNMDIQDWIRIATEIELNYTFDAFVILHGTDTMAYTSSALSFLLEDLGKTVILTGAQIPLSQLRNDAVDNLMGALTIAGHYIIPECCLYFNHTLYRGNRVTKMSAYDLGAFDSPNFPPLVNVGIDIVVNWNDVIRQTSLRRFKAHKKMSPHVATLRLFPGISGATIKAFLEALKEACDRGVVVVAITQCSKGSVSDAYETGRTLLKAGVIPGGDMTPECALTKLGYLLSKPELSHRQVRELIGTPLRGELTRPSRLVTQDPTVDKNLENIQELLSQFVRLSHAPSKAVVPRIETPPDPATGHSTAPDAAAPWSWTAAEAATTEAVLFPFLVHLAAARDDIESLKYCLRPVDGDDAAEVLKFGMIPGGIVNCLEAGSGRSPLHVAALNGHARAVELLLRAGALVHLRDMLGHTALYLAARQGHENVVDLLVQAGATLGGSDLHFVNSIVAEGMKTPNHDPLRVWIKAGWRPQSKSSNVTIPNEVV
ncbi:L-asparaginase [Pholiota molesta]|nr:L-asparaginase [Pholiota molesta]